MIDLTGYFKIGLGFFQVPYSIVDTNYVTVSGIDRRQVHERRSVTAAIDPKNSETMEKKLGGSYPSGGIAIITNDILYYDGPFIPGDQRLQSFVLYGNRVYRILKQDDYNLQIGQRVYYAKRHFDQDVAPANEFAAIDSLFANNDWQFASDLPADVLFSLEGN